MIEGIKVEEGFLNGLDLRFSPGLNVIIGPRGTGKTSIIELIRFCLGVEGLSERSNVASRNHALAILGSGQITVTLRDDGETITVVRNAEDEEPRASAPFKQPIVLSQNEIEVIGL